MTRTYTSTRGLSPSVTFSQALVQGQADDGGLFVPKSLPKLPAEILTPGKTYTQYAYELYHLWETDIPEDILHKEIASAYTSFTHPDIAPVYTLEGNTHILEQWHGPTAAFKDFALQLFPRLFGYSLARQKPGQRALILAATSGDTGSAALEGFSSVPGAASIAFFPEGGTSAVQREQMLRAAEPTTAAFGVMGDFDAIQSEVKNIFHDADFARELLDTYQVSLSSANSINWGRLIPQMVYYIHAYHQLVLRGAIQNGDPLNIVVPSGNFGNLLAAWYCRHMGLPLGRLICACNANNALSDFLRTGTYDIRNRTLEKTISPSMDILVSSNLERFLWHITGGESERIRTWQQNLKTEKVFQVDEATHATIRDTFSAFAANDTQTKQTVQRIYRQTGYVLDPHTATAMHALELYRRETGDQTPTLVCATAHWGKFSLATAQAIFPDEDRESLHEEERVHALEAQTKSPLPPALRAVLQQSTPAPSPITVEGMRAVIRQFLSGK